MSLPPLKDWSADMVRAEAAEWAKSKGLTLSASAVVVRGRALMEEEDALGILFSFFSSPPPPELTKELYHHLHERGPPPPAPKLPENVATNFFAAFQGEEHVEFVAYAKECLDAFLRHQDSVLSPYIALVQSSGYGKTRLLMEAGKLVPLVYVCARQSGYPARTATACSCLGLDEASWRGATDADRNLQMRLLAMYITAQERDMCNNVEKQFRNGPDFDEFWAQVKAKQQEMIDSKASIKEWVNGIKKETVLLAIDEASTLLEIPFSNKTVFRALRHAVRELAILGVNLILVVDTFSKASSFLPLPRITSSYRPTQSDETKRLFHPFVLSSTFDLFCEQRSEFGRPLVAEHATRTSFLQSKLLFATSVKDASAEGKLAAMAARVALNISPQGRVSEMLVASHMATVIAASLDRESLLVTYLSEPPLAAAASAIWNSSPTPNQLTTLLPALHDALVSGAVSSGWAGEIVAQIVLLHAFDSVCPAPRLRKYVALKALLAALLPNEATVDEYIPSAHQNAQVSILQFVQLPLNFDVNELAIQEAYARQTAWVLPPGQAGADLLVPYKFGDSYSFVLVQVKNWAKASGFAQVLKKLRPSSNDGSQECTMIYLHLGDDDSDTQSNASETVCGAKALELYGVGFRCVTAYEGLAQGLMGLLTAQFLERGRQQTSVLPVPKSDVRKALGAFPFTLGGQ